MPQSNDRRALTAMLEYGRGSLKGGRVQGHSGTRSAIEMAFISRFLLPLPGIEMDPFGNYHVMVGEGPLHTVLWSCHTDTVHHVPRMQGIVYDETTGMLALSKKSKRASSCLGADDTAGVWLCVEMIKAGVCGHYIFHHAEESGGIGSSDLASQAPGLLADIKFAIALDRADYADIITHQIVGRCASDAFALSLQDALATAGLNHYRPCDSGVFTDTANYTDIIGECTNLSVGYHHAHTPYECVSLPYLVSLRDALCRLDTSTLVSERIPGTLDARDLGDDWGYYSTKPSRPMLTIVDGNTVSSEFYCDQCCQAYDPDTSNAARFLKFCDRDCEDAFLDVSSWLDKSYGDAQIAITAQSKKGVV